jgi:hypothetical protein
MPMVLSYTAIIYWVFRGKVSWASSAIDVIARRQGVVRSVIAMSVGVFMHVLRHRAVRRRHPAGARGTHPAEHLSSFHRPSPVRDRESVSAGL